MVTRSQEGRFSGKPCNKKEKNRMSRNGSKAITNEPARTDGRTIVLSRNYLDHDNKRFPWLWRCYGQTRTYPTTEMQIFDVEIANSTIESGFGCTRVALAASGENSITVTEGLRPLHFDGWDFRDESTQKVVNACYSIAVYADGKMAYIP
ncbi:MAG TPA: hypothetical protein VEA59_04240 [Patescibacteria group bacterium]|nr:hypothetical protein [Patescibacteria group bacterium]